MVKETIEMKNLKLETLKRKLEKEEANYADLEEEIESLSDELDTCESKCNDFEKQIKEIQQEIESEKTLELLEGAASSELDFAKAFYQTALFCNHFMENRDILKYVNIKDSVLQGCNGCMAVEIKCDDIPENLKNKLIAWDTDGFENPKVGEGEYVNLEKVFGDFFEQQPESMLLTKEEIEKQIIEPGEANTDKRGETETYVLDLNKHKIGMNPKYLLPAFQILPDDEIIRVYWKSPVTPIAFETSKIKCLVLPVRLRGYYE